MSVRSGFALFLALSTLLFLAACGNSNNVTNPVAPPSGGFSASNLNGTYVFSVTGTDSNSEPYSMAGTLTANGSGGSGGISSGLVDINDVTFVTSFSPPIIGADLPISNGSYNISVDGRGQIKFTTSNAVFPSVVLDFVLSTSSHGLVSEFDVYGTGSGTLDLQSAGTTPTGSYAFSLSGAAFASSFQPYAAVGNFALTGTTASGIVDSNEDGLIPSLQGALGGSVVVSSTAPSTTLNFPQFGTLTFDVFPIDASHLKFIEMDEFATLVGDAFSQTSTQMPVGTLPFTLEGETNAEFPFAAGGFITTDSTGDITAASSEDVAEFTSSGVLVPSTQSFTGSYTAAPASSGRYTLSNFSGFVPASSTFAAYPSSGGLLMLEVDSQGITTGAAYTQTPGATLAPSEGYALNFSGFNATVDEVDDIAEFTASSSGDTVTGIVDENSFGNGPSGFFDLALTGTYSLPGPSGQVSASADTENGGFLINYYPVDGTTFPFIETDGGQVAAGVFVEQNATAAAGAASAHSHIFMPHPLVRPHAVQKKKTN